MAAAKASHPLRLVSSTLLLVLLTACVSDEGYYLMPRPNLYREGGGNPFDAVPGALQTTMAEVLYVTDRQPEQSTKTGPVYGYRRSRALAYGLAAVEFGDGLSWESLTQKALEYPRAVPVPVRLVATQESARFPETPAEMQAQGNDLVESPESLAAEEQASQQFCRFLEGFLQQNHTREVLLYIHGYDAGFEDPLISVAELWHFMGRGMAPIGYSWPAGIGGLKGYAYDRESSEFTVYHLKALLRAMGSCAAVDRVNVVAHSRGTDALVSALRELNIWARAAKIASADAFKLGTVVLAAPDIDFEVASQRASAERIWFMADRFLVYVSHNDRELAKAAWLFDSTTRVGELSPSNVRPGALEKLQEVRRFQIIDASICGGDAYATHGYFLEHPAASADLILAIRDRLYPGSQGRPLKLSAGTFWEIYEGYPSEK